MVKKLCAYVEYYDEEREQWLLIEKADQQYRDSLIQEIESIKNDERELLKNIFNGELKTLEDEIDNLFEVPCWLSFDRNLIVFNYLTKYQFKIFQFQAFKNEQSIVIDDDFISSSEGFQTVFGLNVTNFESRYAPLITYTEDELYESIRCFPELNPTRSHYCETVQKYIDKHFFAPLEELKKETCYKNKKFRFSLFFV